MFGKDKKYKINYHGKMDFFTGAKKSYREGEKVHFYFNMIATDTLYSFYIDGGYFRPDYSARNGFEFKFTMPGHNIDVVVNSRNTMLYEPPREKKELS